MFGDKAIYGTYNKTLDEKGRVFLPSVTCAETGDELFLMTYHGCIKVIAKRKVEQIIKLIESQMNALEIEDPKEAEQLRMKRDSIYESIIREVVVDSSKRINTHSLFGETKEIVAIGHCDSLVLKKR
jgi:DNA-binding transcriptional regulator/RsmH inhibitor MraZ